MTDEGRARSRVVVTTSWDDGHKLDDRLAALLDRYGIAGTFYIAPHNAEIAARDRLSPAGVRDLSERFEIGGHTLTHQRLPRLTDSAAADEIRAGKEELEGTVGAAVTSFCYPRGEYTAAHVDSARAVGFERARTVRRNSLAAGPPLELPTTVHAYAHRVDGPVALRLARLRPRRAARMFLQWDELAVSWFDLCLERGGVFHLWGHSWEVDAHRDWQRLERVLSHVSGRPGVGYLPNRALPERAR
ncbi:polysaccharide deacetylase family protein [Streptomyces sp. NPDC013457]|uniref:polysaccharide deacetylase family protein n=1 Tax=Streptomyces sp. NPDC013457 TaxID=3364866 RepID=UPI0036FF61D5